MCRQQRQSAAGTFYYLRFAAKQICWFWSLSHLFFCLVPPLFPPVLPQNYFSLSVLMYLPMRFVALVALVALASLVSFVSFVSLVSVVSAAAWTATKRQRFASQVFSDLMNFASFSCSEAINIAMRYNDYTTLMSWFMFMSGFQSSYLDKYISHVILSRS